MKSSEVLDKAADLIEENGWFRATDTKTFNYPAEGKTNFDTDCATTAIRKVCRMELASIYDTEYKFAKFIDPKFHTGNTFDTIAKWNDAQPVATNVIRRLRSVAKKLRAKGE